jgi:hypothetical protein
MKVVIIMGVTRVEGASGAVALGSRVQGAAKWGT